MLTAAHCDLFNQPFFQFAQLKKYAPETIEPLKASYKAAWQDWKNLILHIFQQLHAQNPLFAEPHIERWCNGWQVRAHFFAFFKYQIHQKDAPILSIILNRRRLTVSLDWHCYKAAQSTISLIEYQRWLQALDKKHYADFDMWLNIEDEYATHRPLQNWQPEDFRLKQPNHYFCIGKHLERDELAQHDVEQWLIATIQTLLPLYESCFTSK